MSGKIFLSYRRSDTKAYTHVVAQPLVEQFGEDQVFLDVYDIELGRDFVEVLEQAVSACDVLLAMIGPGWLNATAPDSPERRLDDPMDFVRIEIATALQRNIRVIPVLVQNATMPAEEDLPDVLKPLARRQALFIGERPAQDIEYQLIPALQRALNEAYNERQAKQTDSEAPRDESSRFRSSRGVVYVVSPQGRQQDRNGNWIDFDQVYQQVIKPGIRKAGFTPVRADEEALYYDITAEDQIQYLLLSQIVIADISIHDAETFYQLGLRHALRKKGVIHVNSSRKNTPIRSLDMRAITYFVSGSGLPDAKETNVDVEKIARAIVRTAEAEEDTIQSPVFDLLTGLPEQDARSLRTPNAQGYWREYNQWKELAMRAQRARWIGDILILTDEIVNPLIKVEAIQEAMQAMRNLGRNELALTLCRQGLQLDPRKLAFRREESNLLNRLGHVDEAIVKLENLLSEYPNDSEGIAHLARIYKELWTSSWKTIKEKKDRISEAYKSAHWLVKAVDIYLRAYKVDLNQYYPGINAVTLASILNHLAKRFEKTGNPGIDQIRDTLPALRYSVQFGLENIAGRDTADYWTLISLAELHVATAEDVGQVTRAYQKAMTASRRNLFFIQSSLGQLDVWDAIDFRPGFVAAGRQVLRDELKEIHGGDRETRPGKAKAYTEGRRVFFFAGQPMDKPDQPIPVFPPEKELDVWMGVKRRLLQYNAQPNDLAICTGIGRESDVAFCEIAVELGVRVELYLPYEEERFIRDQIEPAGEAWLERYRKVRSHPLVDVFIQDERIGPPKPGIDPIRRNLLWGAYSALGRGELDSIRSIFLWDGRAVEGTAGAVIKEAVDFIRQRGLILEWIDLNRLSEPKKTAAASKTGGKKKKTAEK